MDVLVPSLLVFTSGLLSAVITWLIMGKKIADLRDRYQWQQSQLESKNREIAGLTKQVNSLQSESKQLLERKEFYKRKSASDENMLREREKNLRDQKENFELQKKDLTKAFENLANKIFEAKTKSFDAETQNKLGMTLRPLKEQIDGFKKRLNEINDKTVANNKGLEKEIEKVLEMGLVMQNEAHNLTSALKGDSQKRGAWGEAQLEKTLQSSGLVKGDHYTSQDNFSGTDGTRKRTDYLIRLPDKKCLVIDSKVSLVDYERAVSAETDEESEVALRAHIVAVKKHIDDLHVKDYATLDGIDSPDYVLMFMPIEPAFIEALKFDTELFAYGFSKNVILVSHTTLIPILRTVCNLWILDQSNKEVRELGDSAVDVWNAVVAIAKQVQDLGKTLNTAGRKYNDLVTKVVGQQGLARKVERFSQMSNKTAAEKIDESSRIEICSDDLRLNLEAKPLEEDEELTPGG